MNSRFVFLAFLSLSPVIPMTGAHVAGQDTRTVVEPKLPPVCTRVDAQLQTSAASLKGADERKLDTERIQMAIDGCSKGKGVLLRGHGSANAFLSGPLELRAGVTLIVDKGVTLFGSRDAAVYGTAQGSCGFVRQTPGPRGCKALIAVDHAPGSGIMGDGTIDGRGGEKMLGSP